MATAALFPPTPPTPGNGHIHAVLLPPNTPTLSTFEFTYPLKLISSTHPTPPTNSLTIFLLSYGGGLVSNDRINLTITLDPNVKLTLLTQGSTKVFKLRPGDEYTEQKMTVVLREGSALALLPDPVQPYKASVYRQWQRFVLPKDGAASLVVLDWVSEGRSSRGERWQLGRFESRNEVFEEGHVGLPAGGRRLLLRDSILLEGEPEGEGQDREDGEWGGPKETLYSRMDGLTCISTLIIRGPKFSALSAHILHKFDTEARIGSGGHGWNWDKNRHEGPREPEYRDILWTAAMVRGFVLVKVSAREVEEARNFILDLLLQGCSFVQLKEEDGEEEPQPGGKKVVPDLVREFGLGCLRSLQEE